MHANNAPCPRPRVLLVPPPQLPVPAAQGGAVETLLTQLIRENERQGRLELLCASCPDPAARSEAAGFRHTQMLYLATPRGHRRYWPLALWQRCRGAIAPYQPWYQHLLLTLMRRGLRPDVLVAEGGNLTQLGGLSHWLGRDRCLAHLHGVTAASPQIDAIFGGALCLSEFVRAEYLKTSALPPARARLLFNCIDTTRFTPGPVDAALRARLGFAPGDFVLMFCGRLTPDKGIHKLLEALALVPDPRIKLLIVGSPFFGSVARDEFSCGLERQAAALGDRVRFTGYLANAELPVYYRLADLFCAPALWEEPAGLVAIEAMACGCPVLATRSGGMPEYLAGSGAVLVERGPALAAQLAQEILQLRGDPARRAQMAEAGVRTAQAYSVPAYYETFAHIVGEFAQGGPQ